MLKTNELKKLGLEAAERAAGEGAVEEVEVEAGEDDFDRPIYRFSFLIQQDRARDRAGLVRIRLIQSLQDALESRGDGRYPVVRILDRVDWERRAVG
jgi:hypothetical protein